MAGSVDSVEKTQVFIDKLGISFPVAVSMKAEVISELTGAFYEKERKYLQPTSFIIRPDKTIEIAVYSTGAVGRFAAKDILALIKYLKSRQT